MFADVSEDLQSVFSATMNLNIVVGLIQLDHLFVFEMLFKALEALPFVEMFGCKL